MAEPKKLLLVEDDEVLRRGLRAALEGSGYRVSEAEGLEAGLHLFRTQKPDLVVLDVQLPDGSGLDICRKIRSGQSGPKTPVIMLTGKSELEEKGAGFAAGADQYLIKPVHPRELLMWVEALLRRLSYDQGDDEILRVGELEVDRKAYLARWRGAALPELTGKEFELLYFLVRHRPKLLTRKHILSTLWHTVAVDNVVDKHIGHLRKKLPPELADRVQNVPGKGFRFFE